MQEAKPYLDKFLNDTHYDVISETMSSAYKACDDLFSNNLVLREFLTGWLMRSRLITPFVEHSLSKVDFLHYDFRPNNPRNWYQATFHKSELAITAHFLGVGKTRRSGARKALCRAELNDRNGDLFASESEEPDILEGHSYCHILHGGFNNLDSLAIAIPKRNQKGYFASSVIEIKQPKQEQVEEIRETMMVKLLNQDVQESIKST